MSADTSDGGHGGPDLEPHEVDALVTLAYGLADGDREEMGVSEAAARAIKRVNDLDERVADLEAGGGGGGSIGTDARDQAVLDALAEQGAERVSLSDLKHLYRSETDIRTPSTLKTRVKSLTSGREFEFVTSGVWQFTGGEGDD